MRIAWFETGMASKFDVGSAKRLKSCARNRTRWGSSRDGECTEILAPDPYTRRSGRARA